ncbi:hypothetical protein IQ07DRAFT_518899 [Pyrenochaeta sp. DS3sAY3a]|nr:hypothetical protein IQ07DRAFT_518899 [Pyrenochaeta sp. DS3sAY3a]
MFPSSATLEASPLTPSALEPPAHLFRIVKQLSPPTSTHSAVFLCLPRNPLPAFSPDSECAEFLCPNLHVRNAFRKLRDPRFKQQLRLLEYVRLADTLVPSIIANGASVLPQRLVKMLPQLVVVKMNVSPEALGKEADVVEELHSGREYSTLFIGTKMIRGQITADPSSSWICLRPVFGHTIPQLGEAFAKAKKEVPDWLVAHILLGLISAAQFVHGDGLVYGNVSAENTMINLYPEYMHHRYRGYPDIQLVGFSQAEKVDDTSGGAAKDVRDVMMVIVEFITKWSSATPYFGTGIGLRVSQEPLVLLWQQVQEILAGNEKVTWDDMGGLIIHLEELRGSGPKTLPKDIIKILHSDLASQEELKSAMKGSRVVVLKFHARRADYARILMLRHIEWFSGGQVGNAF